MNPQHLAIPGTVRVEVGPGGLTQLVVSNDHADAAVFLQGAHVASFQPRNADPVLWMSPTAIYQPGKALRGGIPVCWPWFGPHPFDARQTAHGIVRTREWTPVESMCLHDGSTRIVLAYQHDGVGPWPFKAEARLEVTVGRRLTVELVTANRGDEPVTYQDALHTYLTVGDVRQCVLHGFDHAPYIDKADNHQRKVHAGPLRLTKETVSIFTRHHGTIEIEDPVLGRRLIITKQGSEETVVWNPWATVASTMQDLGTGWSEMLCVEAATCCDRWIHLDPAGEHRTRQTIGIA